MIEVDKMLHLNRYVTLLRIGTKSRVVHLHLRSSSCETSLPPHRGYVFRYAHHGLVQKMHLQIENYAATGINMFSTTVSQLSVDDINHKVTSLRDDIKNGQVSADSLREVITLYNKSDHQLHHSTGILLLRCCGNLLPDLNTTERQHLADQVWHLAKKNSEGLTVEYYNALLDVHMDNSTSVNPKEFLANMSVEPNEDTYRLLLNTAIKTGNSKHLQDIMSLIKKNNIVIDEEAFNTLVQIYATNGNLTDIEHAITLMRNRKLSTDKAYTELACGYAKLGDIPNLVKILNDEPQNDTNLFKIMKVLSMSNNGRHILVVLNLLTPSVSDYEIGKIITELIHINHIADAHMIVNYLATKDETKDKATSLANSFLNKLVILNLPVDDIMKYVSDFLDSGYELLVLTNLAEIGLKLSRENLCLATFQVMRDKDIKLRPHYYWPLLATAHRDKGEAKIFSLVKSMINMGVEIDSDTLLNFVFPYVNTVNPAITMQKLLLNDVPSSIAYTPLISFLLSQNRLQDVISYNSNVRYKARCKELIKPLVRAYITTRNIEKCVSLLTIFPGGRDFVGLFLKSLLHEKYSNLYVEDLIYLLKEFNKYQIKISQRDAIILKERLSARNFVEKNVFASIDNITDNRLEELVHAPMHMNTQELNCALVEFKSKGLNTKTILRWLLDAYYHEKNFKKCEEIKQEFDACQYELTPGIKMTLIEIYIKSNKLKKAKALLSNIHTAHRNFRIDKFKIVMIAHALVKAGEVKEAFEVIETTKQNDKRIEVQKSCQLLLEALAQSQHYACTEDMLNLLLQKNYCKISTEILRPLVRIPLERNNIAAAINTFMKCVHQYKKAPLALELLITLLQQKDKPDLLELSDVNKYIEQVYDKINSLYGNDVANTQLIIALATLNKTQELENILQTQQLSISSLRNYYFYVQRKDDISSLFTIFKLIPDTSNLDKNVICEMLLSFYTKKGYNNDVLELWKIMCAKNIKPSKLFERIFIQHLLLNKIPLPPEFEQDKSKINVSN